MLPKSLAWYGLSHAMTLRSFPGRHELARFARSLGPQGLPKKSCVSGAPIGPQGPKPNVSCMVQLITADHPKKSSCCHELARFARSLGPHGPPKKSSLSGAPTLRSLLDFTSSLASFVRWGPRDPLRSLACLGPLLGPRAPTLMSHA